jgi:hypothetical protein
LSSARILTFSCSVRTGIVPAVPGVQARRCVKIGGATAIGRDVASALPARALNWHANHRLLIKGYKTVVFGLRPQR